VLAVVIFKFSQDVIAGCGRDSIKSYQLIIHKCAQD